MLEFFKNREYLFKQKKNFLPDFFFSIQIVAAIYFGIIQVGTLLNSVKGASITWIGFWFIFVFLNLTLTMGAYKKLPDRVMLQAVVNYAAWTIVIGLSFIVLIYNNASWNTIDTFTAFIAAVGFFVIILVSRKRGIPSQDPVIKGMSALLLKAVPQCTLAFNIWINGGDGIALYTIIIGHVIINVRIGQVLISVKKSGWDRHRASVVVGEVGNEVSWVIASVVWFAVMY